MCDSTEAGHDGTPCRNDSSASYRRTGPPGIEENSPEVPGRPWGTLKRHGQLTAVVLGQLADGGTLSPYPLRVSESFPKAGDQAKGTFAAVPHQYERELNALRAGAAPTPSGCGRR